MAEIKLIATDMDHTLLTEKGELPPNTTDLILDLHQLGIEFTIASGRPLYTLTHVFEETHQQMTFIADNGAIIRYHGEIIFKSLLPIETYQAIIHFIESETDGIAILCGLDTAIISEEQHQHLDFLRTFYRHIQTTKDFSTLAIDADKLTIYFPNENSKAYYDTVFKPKYCADLSVTVGDTIWIDFMNKGIDKGSALRFLSHKLAVSADEMMAFGDTYNDVEMLKAVKYSYIVANASEDMRQYANFITKSNDDDGVSEIIRKVIKNNGHL